jgi:hypothetical protein
VTDRLSGDPVISVAAELVACDLADQTAILNLRSEVYYGLDTIGTHIWSLIQQKRCLSEIRDVLLAHYEVGEEACEASLRRFLGNLYDAGLIEISTNAELAVPVGSH